MNVITDEQFLEWFNSQEPPKTLDDAFVIITTKVCSNCTKLRNGLGTINHPDIKEYYFNPKNKEIVENFKALGIDETPAFLIKCIVRYKGFLKTLVYYWDKSTKIDIVELECIFEALRDDQHTYFGYDEYGIPLNKNNEIPEIDEIFYRLSRTIHGEINSEEFKMRQDFEETINHLGTIQIKPEN